MIVAIQRADGGVSIMHLAASATAAAEIEKWKGVHPGEYVSHAEVAPEALPTDRTFRNAWALNGGKVEHDLTKARQLAHTMRRSQRDQEMAPFDTIIARQVPGDNLAAAETARAALRTKYAAIQTAIDAAPSPEAIKAALVPKR